MANGATGNLTDQLGPDFQDIDWRHYDPRHYDPRKIIRDALLDDEQETPAEEEPTPETPNLDHDTTAAARESEQTRQARQTANRRRAGAQGVSKDTGS